MTPERANALLASYAAAHRAGTTLAWAVALGDEAAPDLLARAMAASDAPDTLAEYLHCVDPAAACRGEEREFAEIGGHACPLTLYGGRCAPCADAVRAGARG